jgi:hypothetical protein
MSLAARLTKLEGAAGKGKWCAYCRLVLRSSPPVAFVYAKTRDVPAGLKKKCRFCGNEYNVQPAEGDSPCGRALSLLNSYQDEDFYTTEKACAVAA